MAKTQLGLCNSLEIIFNKNKINVNVELILNTNTCVTWHGITDYEYLEKFHSTLKKSEILKIKGNKISINQVFKSYFFGIPFNSHHLFLVNEIPEKLILEINQIKGEFNKYYSIWRIEKKNKTRLKIKTNITISNLQKIFVSKKMLTTQYNKFANDLRKQLKNQKYENLCSN